MKFSIVEEKNNSVDVELGADETLHIKNSFLKEDNYETRIIPPHPWGSVIARLMHGNYWMKCLKNPGKYTITGIYPRGNFAVIEIPAKQQMYIDPKYVVGFCNDLKSIHTHIKLFPNKSLPTFLLLRKYFFSTFTGPGNVIIYTDSNFAEATELKFQPDRIVAFDISRKFKATPPKSDETNSQFIQFCWSHEVIWKFIDEGKTWTIKHMPSDESGRPQNTFKELIKHILGFFRF